MSIYLLVFSITLKFKSYARQVRFYDSYNIHNHNIIGIGCSSIKSKN